MKASDLFSERMVFGFLLIVGFIVLLHELLQFGSALRPEVVTMVASGMGALGAAVGIIVQAIWKTDKADKQAADTAAVLAAKAPNLADNTVLPLNK